MAATARWKGAALEAFYAIEGKRGRWNGAALELFYTTTPVQGHWNGAALENFYVPGVALPTQGRWNGAALEIFYGPPESGGGGGSPVAPVFKRPIASSFMAGPSAQESSP